MPTPAAAFPDLIAFGEAMIEFNQRGGAQSRDFLQGFGGDTSNVVIAAARQGARTGYVSALGEDTFGAMLRQLWAREGVDTRGVLGDPDAFTACYFVTHDEAGHHFEFRRKGSAASRLGPDRLPRDLLGKARILHLSGISLAISPEACDAGFTAMAEARKGGAQIAFDTNLRLRLWPKDRARAVISEAIAQCDICLPGLEDMAALTGLSEPDAIFDYCHARGPSLVILKLGAEGALVSEKGALTRIPAHPCRPLDATGAGDCFAGAFLARLLAGDTPVQAASYAGVAAALSTEGYGAVEPIPYAATVLAAMAGRAGQPTS
ncbi:MAG: sugar kinase [Proteobacteria bacterium]|nr:sugar kinase [Pseudomonadota bacterium]